jgi:isopentenyl diphosphate isomerase/L-lactate dehydrogenase-like FMN-dependent dehydrogenase
MAEELPEPINLLEYEPLARAKLPKWGFDYIAGGAEDEVTMRENRAAFERIQLRPRMLVDVSSIDASTTVLGTRVAFPVLLAPAGTQGVAHPDGELATARAASAAGTVTVVSTVSSHSLEDVAACSAGPKWFQLYAFTRDLAPRLIERAQNAGYSAVFLTVDVQRAAHRERDIRNAFLVPPAALPRTLVGEIDLREVVPNPTLTWQDIDWLRSLTSLPFGIKGIMTAEDARLAVEHGVDAIVVSNHGGRQLDGAQATIEVLEEVVEAVDGKCEVFLDGGVRRGTDVVKALALGAKAVLIGRPYLYGLAVDGEAGVKRVLDLLRAELETAMALMGCPTVAAITRDVVVVRG